MSADPHTDPAPRVAGHSLVRDFGMTFAGGCAAYAYMGHPGLAVLHGAIALCLLLWAGSLDSARQALAAATAARTTADGETA